VTLLDREVHDVRLDLQSALASFYDRAGYDLILDYAAEPVPTLEATWSRWADELLHARGVRG
jgi:hypothetical protein